MASSHDIIALTSSAVEALEAVSPKSDSERIVENNINEEEVEVIFPESKHTYGEKQTLCHDSARRKENTAREISPLVPDSDVEIVDICGATTRFRDRTLKSGESSPSNPEHTDAEDNHGGVQKTNQKSRDGVHITRFSGNTKECRQKLASRKKFNDASSYHHDSAVYPKVVQAQVIAHKRPAHQRMNGQSSMEKAMLDPFEKENQQSHQEQAAILSAATSAAAAAAVGTQPVLKEIESRINELTNKLSSLEAGRLTVLEESVNAAPADSVRRSGRFHGGDVDERLLRELAVERELAKERERQRKRDDYRREKENQKFQRQLLALTALHGRARSTRQERKSLPVEESRIREERRPHILEEILHKEEFVEEEDLRRRPSSFGVVERMEADSGNVTETRNKLQNFEMRLNSELMDIRAEFEELRKRADTIASAEPVDVPFSRPRLTILSEAPPRNEVLELADRQLERIGHMQENLEQNIASIERAREAEFFYSVLNDLSGDQNAINSAVTRIMVDDALKRASKEAKRQVEREWRSGHASHSADPEDVKSARPPHGQSVQRRGPQAKIDSGLRRRKPSLSPPREETDANMPPKPSSVFGSINSLVDFNILRPGQLGNRRQRGERAPYLHFSNPVKERRHSPVNAVRYQSPPREASVSPSRRPREEEKKKRMRSHITTKKVQSHGRMKQTPKCQLLFFRQHDPLCSSHPHHPHEIDQESNAPSKSDVTEVVIDESRNVTPTALHRSSDNKDSTESEAEIPPNDDAASDVSEVTRSEDGEGLELPGWRKPERKRLPFKLRQSEPRLDTRPSSKPPLSGRSGRDPLETRIRNRLEDEVIAEVVSRMGHRRELAVQTCSPPPEEKREDTAHLRDVVQEVVLSEAMRLLRRSLPQQPPRVSEHDVIRVPTPIPSPEGPSFAEDIGVEAEEEVQREEYSDEFEDELSVEESLRKSESPSPPPQFSLRHEVETPTFSSEEEEEEASKHAEEYKEVKIVIPVTPELSPRDSENVPVPTPRLRTAPLSPPPSLVTRVESAVQTVQEAAVQTAAAIEVQTDPQTPEPPPVEETEPLSVSSGLSSSESSPPSESLMSDGQWMLDRSEGQHHDICVDWAMRQHLATAAMTSRRRPGAEDSSVDLTAEVRTLTEEGEAAWTRRYDPQRDLLMQLLLEQQHHARSGVIVPDMLGILDSAGATLVSGDFDSLSVGQVPRPVPRYRRSRSGGDMSGATSSGINDEGLEDTPVRDSGGSLPPGIIRVRESVNSDDAQKDIQDTERSHLGGTTSDKMDVDLARYLGMSLNTTTGTGGSEDFTKTGMLSTTQLIQDALQTTELSATGEPSNAGPVPRHRVNITVPTLAEVPSDSPSPDEDVSEILMP